MFRWSVLVHLQSGSNLVLKGAMMIARQIGNVVVEVTGKYSTLTWDNGILSVVGKGSARLIWRFSNISTTPVQIGFNSSSAVHWQRRITESQLVKQRWKYRTYLRQGVGSLELMIGEEKILVVF